MNKNKWQVEDYYENMHDPNVNLPSEYMMSKPFIYILTSLSQFESEEIEKNLKEAHEGLEKK